MALTEKQRRFADEYLIDFNATQAAIRAGYSRKTAYSQGQRLLKNVEVQEHLKERINKEDDTRIAKGDEVLQFLTQVMRGELDETHIDRDGNQVGYVDQRNQIKAAELLAKCHGLTNQNLNVSGAVGITFIDDLPDDDDE